MDRTTTYVLVGLGALVLGYAAGRYYFGQRAVGSSVPPGAPRPTPLPPVPSPIPNHSRPYTSSDSHQAQWEAFLQS